mgnify:FL=1
MENHSIKDLETYKKLVEKCLRENYNHTENAVQYLMKEYEPDFKFFFEDECEPAVAAIGMVMNLI